MILTALSNDTTETFNVSNIVEIKLGSPKKQELHRISRRDLLRDTIVIDNEERKSKRS